MRIEEQPHKRRSGAHVTTMQEGDEHVESTFYDHFFGNEPCDARKYFLKHGVGRTLFRVVNRRVPESVQKAVKGSAHALRSVKCPRYYSTIYTSIN